MIDKERIIQAIWDNPETITGLSFRLSGNTWQSSQRLDGSQSNRKDKTLLRMARDGHTIFVNYNGSQFPAGQDIFEFLQWKNSTNDFYEVLLQAAEAYGIPVEDSPDELERFRQRNFDKELLQTITKHLQRALNTEKGAAARAYLESRNLQPSEDFGAYSDEIRADIKNAICEDYQLTDEEAEGHLRRIFTGYPADSYQLAMPYYNGSSSSVRGFCLRYTSDDPMNERQNKYQYSKGMAKGGYCRQLTDKEPVLLVEGLLDAIALRQAGFGNVLAMGGVAPTESEDDANKNQVKTLQRYGIRNITYVPDYEHNEDGTLKTAATDRAIEILRRHLTGKVDGKGFTTLKVAELHNCNRQDIAKDDAASFLQRYGADFFRGVLNDAVNWYDWQLQKAVERYKDNPDELAAAAVGIYQQIGNPIDRELLQRGLNGSTEGEYFEALRNAGITASSLKQIDRRGTAQLYREKMTEAVGNLNEAIEKHSTAETIGDLLTRAQRIQHTTSEANFFAQLNVSREQINQQIKNKPDYLETDWDLWTDYKGEKKAYRHISFAPANISVVGAPTSHGKTLFMILTAIHLATKYKRRFIYASFENDIEQLYIRAIAAYIGNKWKGPGDLRKEIRKRIKGTDDLPEGNGSTGLYDTDGSRYIDEIDKGMADYWKNVAPYLRFVRAGSEVDGLCNNITAIVEEWQQNGTPVGGIFLDYVQLLHLTGRNYSRTDEVKQICDLLNELAKDTGLPIIVGSQMNREATKNKGDKIDGVELANLGESSGIENIAEDCYLLWNTNKVKATDYLNGKNEFSIAQYQYRSRRLFTDETDRDSKKENTLYVESLKARESATGCYCLLPVDWSTGALRMNNEETTDN